MPAAPRFYCPAPLATGSAVQLPPGAARHVQVLRLQPGDPIRLFDNAPAGGEFDATVHAMGRQSVAVLVGGHNPTQRETGRVITVAIGMPANERMDWLVEKATELGVAVVQPLMTQHSVVRLSNERSQKRVEHWRGIAIAACEQCGRNRLPTLQPPMPLGQWSGQLETRADLAPTRLVLSLMAGSRPLRDWLAAEGAPQRPMVLLCGPEGGLSEAEERSAVAAGFVPVSLGARVLRSETAALVALTLVG